MDTLNYSQNNSHDCGRTIPIAERMASLLDREPHLSPDVRVCLVDLVSAIEQDKDAARKATR